MMKQLSWTTKQFIAFKKAYSSAVNQDYESFFFEGNEFFTSYAKYLIEYLEPQNKE